MDKIQKSVTPGELVLTLFAHEFNEDGNKSAEFFQYTAVTKPKCLVKHRVTKVPNPYGQISKHTTARALLKAIYENAVNNALVRQGEQEKGDNLFEAGELPAGRAWVEVNGKKSKMLMFAEGTGNWLLRMTFANPNEKPEVKYFAENGEELTYEQAEGFLPAKKHTTVTILNESTGDFEDKVVETAVRDYNIANLKEVRLGGVIYTIK